MAAISGLDWEIDLATSLLAMIGAITLGILGVLALVALAVIAVRRSIAAKYNDPARLRP